mmetsp:Transcript_19646/g.26971  ORF Transcript_19646/g.26971 Transcript_19646/m.26971 type:complete len:136 (+) Transcript_19646:1036-1443(+)
MVGKLESLAVTKESAYQVVVTTTYVRMQWEHVSRATKTATVFQENAVRASVLEWIFWLTMVVTVCGTVIAFQDVARDIWTGAVSLKRRTVSVAMKTQTVFQAVVIGGSGAVMVTWMKPFHLFSLHTRTQEGNALI